MIPPLSRRRFLTMAGAGSAAVLVAACSGEVRPPVAIGPADPAVGGAEGRRRRPGVRVTDVALTATPFTVDLGGGLTAPTWAYGDTVPGTPIRLAAGEVLRARFTNNLPEATTVHWHGIALRNNMDGVPGLTQPPVAPGESFLYEFTAPDPGTYWFHPHSGLQLDRGLYAPLIVDDPREPGAYDKEWVVVLDDWADGVGQPAEETLADLRAGRGAHAAHIAAAEGGGEAPSGGPFLQGAGAGDVVYPLYLLNGRQPSDPSVFEARPGERVRIRIINAGSDTPFRVALGGHRMTVTHTDGFPVEPVTVDALVVAMAERYDVVVTVGGSGVFPLVAEAEAKGNLAMGVLRSGPGELPPVGVLPAELTRRVLTMADLRAAQGVRLPEGRPDRRHNLVLGEGPDGGYVWTINGRPHGRDEALPVEEGERVRLTFLNRSTMFHPMHLHGHTFQVLAPGGLGPRKDTTIVRAGENVAVEFVADNPGQWMLHCHNLYHQAGGMMTTVSYVGDRPSTRSELAAQRAAGWNPFTCSYDVPGSPT